MTLVISCEVSHLNSVMKVYVVDKLKIIKNKFFTIIQIEIHTKIVLIILTNSNSFTKKKFIIHYKNNKITKRNA